MAKKKQKIVLEDESQIFAKFLGVKKSFPEHEFIYRINYQNNAGFRLANDLLDEDVENLYFHSVYECFFPEIKSTVRIIANKSYKFAPKINQLNFPATNLLTAENQQVEFILIFEENYDEFSLTLPKENFFFIKDENCKLLNEKLLTLIQHYE